MAYSYSIRPMELEPASSPSVAHTNGQHSVIAYIILTLGSIWTSPYLYSTSVNKWIKEEALNDIDDSESSVKMYCTKLLHNRA